MIGRSIESVEEVDPMAPTDGTAALDGSATVGAAAAVAGVVVDELDVGNGIIVCCVVCCFLRSFYIVSVLEI